VDFGKLNEESFRVEMNDMPAKLVSARVVAIASGPAAFCVVISRLNPEHDGKRIMFNDAFPLAEEIRSNLQIGQRVTLKYPARGHAPVSMAIDGVTAWTPPSSGIYHAAKIYYSSADQRRRFAVFTAHGLPDLATAIGVAQSDPPGTPEALRATSRRASRISPYSDLAPLWEDDKALWHWNLGDPPEGRDMSQDEA
jgi:hypothetical protein